MAKGYGDLLEDAMKENDETWDDIEKQPLNQTPVLPMRSYFFEYYQEPGYPFAIRSRLREGRWIDRGANK